MRGKSNISYSEVGRLADQPVITDIMKVSLENPQLLSLAAGFTDTHSLPVSFVRDETVALCSSGVAPEYLQYGTTLGRPGLRRLVARRLSKEDGHQSPSYHPDNVMITNGSQQALYLAMQVLCDPGDIILVENPSYFVFLELLKGLGIEALGMPVDSEGCLDIHELAVLLRKLGAENRLGRVKGVYLDSWFSNPSTQCLDDGIKEALAVTLKSFGTTVPILEDGAYRELYYRDPYPSSSILALAAFDDFPRLFFGTFDKPFASGLKIGHVVCDHAEIFRKMLSIKGHHDFGSANFTQAIIENAVTNGSYDQQVAKVRSRYAAKMEILHRTLLEEGMRERGWVWSKPDGGMYLWVKGPEEMDLSKDSLFFKSAVEEGVIYIPGDLCFASGAPTHFMRLSFGVLEGEDLARAGKRLVRVVRQYSSPLPV